MGDPCINHWYGITCNRVGNIISFHMFENRIDGLMPDSFGDLKYLKHLTIANDGREHEYVDNPHRNSIYLWNKNAIEKLTMLEEINMQHLSMHGPLTGSLMNLHNLRYLNLGYNQLSGPLSDDPQWAMLQKLEFIELMSNTISGPLPTAWKLLSKLEYVDVGYNNFTGPMLIFEAAQDLKGVDYSDNDFEGDYPI